MARFGSGQGTGSFVLHAAGLLGGKRATTNWGSLQRLRDLGDVLVEEARYTRGGGIWCSSVSAFTAAQKPSRAGQVRFEPVVS
jgi:transcriptional regulator GlxA family with amidase domain